MWRQNTPSRNRDSDEILSDEDDSDQVTYDYDCSKNLQSLCARGNKLQVLSQIESLEEKQQHGVCCSYEDNLRRRNSSALLEKTENFSSEYEIGTQRLENEDLQVILSRSSKEHSEPGDESISDEENALSKLDGTLDAAKVQRSAYYNPESEVQQEVGTWSAVTEEAHKLACLHKKSCGSSFIPDTSEVRKDGRGRAKLKFSFGSLLRKEDLSWSYAQDGNEKSYENNTRDPAGHNNFERRNIDDSLAEVLENIQEQKGEKPIDVVVHEQRGPVQSMTELLEDLQQKNGPLKGPPNMLLQNVKAKQRKTQFAAKKTLHPLGTRTLDNEDFPEFTRGGLSSEDEEIIQSPLSIATQNEKGHTMADIFQEVFRKSELEEPLFHPNKQSGVGYHGRLQQVLQIEKDRHLEFLNNSQIGQNPSNESRSIDVKILSRFLEAKLTVCQCLSYENNNSIQSVKDSQTCAGGSGSLKRTVIFSSKICDNIELEAGKLVRIHPPWKEVEVNEDEKIILCTCFSQILA